MKCHECGRHITPRSKFCPYCGKAVAARQNNKNKATPTKPHWPLYLTLVIAGIALGVTAFWWLQREKSSPAPSNFDPTLRGEPLAKLYPAVYEVAAQFNCPCGDCNDGVEVCDCEMERGAAEVRLFIYQLLQVHERPHVMELVEQKYGHRKNGATTPSPSTFVPPPTWQEPVSKQ